MNLKTIALLVCLAQGTLYSMDDKQNSQISSNALANIQVYRINIKAYDANPLAYCDNMGWDYKLAQRINHYRAAFGHQVVYWVRELEYWDKPICANTSSTQTTETENTSLAEHSKDQQSNNK